MFDGAEKYDEEELFHAWNAAQDSGKPLTMVDQAPPAWEIRLPDLRTRLAVTPVARIEQPDDALFRSIVRLLFVDRGLHIPDDCLKYIGDRVERSLLDGRACRGDRPVCHCGTSKIDPADRQAGPGVRAGSSRQRGAA